LLIATSRVFNAWLHEVPCSSCFASAHVTVGLPPVTPALAAAGAAAPTPSAICCAPKPGGAESVAAADTSARVNAAANSASAASAAAAAAVLALLASSSADVETMREWSFSPISCSTCTQAAAFEEGGMMCGNFIRKEHSVQAQRKTNAKNGKDPPPPLVPMTPSSSREAVWAAVGRNRCRLRRRWSWSLSAALHSSRRGKEG
jgi:hypothetical protein